MLTLNTKIMANFLYILAVLIIFNHTTFNITNFFNYTSLFTRLVCTSSIMYTLNVSGNPLEVVTNRDNLGSTNDSHSEGPTNPNLSEDSDQEFPDPTASLNNEADSSGDISESTSNTKNKNFNYELESDVDSGYNGDTESPDEPSYSDSDSDFAPENNSIESEWERLSDLLDSF